MLQRSRLQALWYTVDSSFWFRPTLMVLAAIVLAMAMLALDDFLEDKMLTRIPLIYGGSPEAAQTILSTIASSTINVVAVTFSITIVALSLASTQFGPRLLNNFMRDEGNQYVLGFFVATFIYCLLIIRAIRLDEAFVPQMAVTLGILLSILAFFVLIYFIHHIASSMKAETLVHIVDKELVKTIEQLCPEAMNSSVEEPEPVPDLPEDFEENSAPAPALEHGYLQALEIGGLVQLAKKKDLVFALAYKPGEYVVQSTPLLRAWPRTSLNRELVKSVNDQFVIGSLRTPFQDLEYAMHQLVEVALRALSPGINDTFTALGCLDRLGSAISLLARRRMPPIAHRDGNGRLRVVMHPNTFAGAMDAAFDAIRQNSAHNAAVTIRMLEMLQAVAMFTRTRLRKESVLRHADMVLRSAERNLPEENDRADVRRRYDELRRMLERPHQEKPAALKEEPRHG